MEAPAILLVEIPTSSSAMAERSRDAFRRFWGGGSLSG